MGKTISVPAAQATTLQVKDTSPEHYWQEPSLRLYWKSATDRSVDTRGAGKSGKANTHRTYVAEMQQDLRTIGYLLKDKEVTGVYDQHTQWAVRRFTRRAGQVYRMKDGKPDDVEPAETFVGGEQAECDARVAAEIRKWIDKGWKVPVGRFPLKEIGHSDGGKPSKPADRVCWTPEAYDDAQSTKSAARVRSDAADAWLIVLDKLLAAGAAVSPYYDSTPRPITFLPPDSSASKHSFHYTGRAVDVDQGLVNGHQGPWFLVSETRPHVNKRGVPKSRQFFRIWSRAHKQDGTQGVPLNLDEAFGPPDQDGKVPLAPLPRNDPSIKTYYREDHHEVPFPPGYYVDVTAIIEANGFAAIPAHENWKAHARSWEWWHFNYNMAAWGTFLDECELLDADHQESKLRATHWKTDGDLDAQPG